MTDKGQHITVIAGQATELAFALRDSVPRDGTFTWHSSAGDAIEGTLDDDTVTVVLDSATTAAWSGTLRWQLWQVDAAGNEAAIAAGAASVRPRVDG